MSPSPDDGERPARWCSRASWSRPETWLALLVALFALSSAWSFGSSWPGIDFYQFWLVGRALREGRVENPYAPEVRTELGEQGFQDALRRAGPEAQKNPPLELQVANYRRQLETFSTPLLYGTFGALASGDYPRDKIRWQRASVALHAGAILLVACAFGLSLASALGALGVFALWFEPFQAEIGNANVNAVLLATLAGALFALVRGRWLGAGLVLGLGLAFKPTLALAPLPLLLAWACARSWRPLVRHALGLAGGAALGVALGAWLGGGLANWSRWLGELPVLLREGAAYDDNFALARWLSDHLGLALGPGLVLLVFTPVAWVAWMRRARAPGEDASAGWLALGALVALLTPGLVWIHYYELAIPAVLCLCARARPLNLLAAALGALALSSRVPAQWLGLANTRQQAGLVLAGALLVFAILLRELACPAQPADRAGSGTL